MSTIVNAFNEKILRAAAGRHNFKKFICSEMAQLIAQKEAEARENGYILHRYEMGSRRNSQVRTVTYALHPSTEPRPKYSRHCEDILFRVQGEEGLTASCKFYKQLGAISM